MDRALQADLRLKFNLHRAPGIGTLYRVKPLHYIVLAAVVLLGVGYVVLRTQDSGLVGTPGTGAAKMAWQKVDRSGDGFKVELPGDVKQIQVPAYGGSSGPEPVSMIFANPDEETTFSVAWADNPPVALVGGPAPDRILEMAQDGALARTQTSPLITAATSAQGFPARDFAAENSGGGVMSSRLIYAGTRLYMLVAAFPSAGARRDPDVTRFFNSFTILPPAGSAENSAAEPAGSN